MLRGLWIATGLAGKLGGIAGTIGGLFSMKILVGLVVGVFLVLSGALLKERSDALKFRTQVNTITTGVGTQLDLPGLKPDQVIDTVRTVITDLDTARAEATSFKSAADRQTSANRRLAQQTVVDKDKASKAMDQLRGLIGQRDKWIDANAKASTNKNWGTCEQELKSVEDTLDALYANHF